MKEKQCSKCKEIKNSNLFYKDPRLKSGLHSWCKQCTNDYNESEPRRSARKKANKQWHIDNKEAVNARRRRRFDTPDGKLRQYKNSAKRKKRVFRLTKKSFVFMVQQRCYYCNEFELNDKNTVGIDRIDSNLGYTQNNCVPCCETCNRMKMELSQDDFFNSIVKIYRTHYEKE